MSKNHQFLKQSNLYLILFIVMMNLFSLRLHADDSDTIIIKGDLDFPPYEFLNDNNEIDGFNVDIMRAVISEMNLDAKIDLDYWHTIKDGLESGEIDVLMGMFHSESRDKIFDFSTPYLMISYAIFVPKKSKISSVSEMMNKKIIVHAEDYSYDYLLENNITNNFVKKNTVEDVLLGLASGEGDCAIVTKYQGLNLIKNLGLNNLHVVGEPIFQKKYCFAVLEGNQELLYTLNEGLSIIKATGLYDEIYEEWFDVLPTFLPESLATTAMITIFLIIFIFFIMYSLFRNKRFCLFFGLTQDIRPRVEFHVLITTFFTVLSTWFLLSFFEYIFYNVIGNSLFFFLFPLHSSYRIIIVSILTGTILISGILLSRMLGRLAIQQKITGEVAEDFRTTLQSIGDAVISTDIESKITNMNYMAEKLTGWKHEEAKGKALFDVFKVFNDYTNEPVESPIQEVLKDKKIIGLKNHVKLLSKDGLEYNISDSAAPITDVGGKITGVVLVFRNITKEYKMREKIIRNEANLRSIFEAANNVAFITTDINGENLKILNFSEGAENIFGYKAKEVIGEFVTIFHKRESLGDYPAILDEMDKSGSSFNGESIFIRKSGEKFWALFAIHPIFEEGKMTGTISVLIDISERKKMEEELADRERSYSTLLNNLPGFAYRSINDEGWVVSFISDGCEKITGYKPEDFVDNKNITFKDIIDQDYKFEVNEYWQKVLKNKDIFEYEYPIITKDKRVRWLWERGCGIFSESGELLFWEGFIADVTEKKKAEKVQNIVFNISNAVNVSDNMQDLFLKIRTYLNEVIDSKNLYVALYDKETEQLSLPFNVDEKDKMKSFPIGKSITRYVIETGKPLFATKEKVEELKKLGLIETIGAPSEIWLGTPLRIKNKIIGLIAVQSYDNPNLYSEKDIEILNFVSDEIAIAIRHKQGEEKILTSLHEKNALLKELYHRTKNNMQIISSMLRAQVFRTDNKFVQETFRTINDKIQAMSLVHKKLYQSQDLSMINLKDYIEDLAKLLAQSYHLKQKQISFRFDLEDVYILMDSAIPLGLVINEFITNCYKYAFPEDRKGEIHITLFQKDEMINVNIFDNGIGLQEELDLENIKTMGIQIAYNLIKSQLNGELEYKVDNGLKWYITLRDDLHKRRI